MHGCFAACISEYLIPIGARRGCQISWNQSKGQLLAIMLVLRTKPRSSGKTVHTDSFNSIMTMIHLALSYLHLYLLQRWPTLCDQLCFMGFPETFCQRQPSTTCLHTTFKLLFDAFCFLGCWIVCCFHFLYSFYSFLSSIKFFCFVIIYKSNKQS